MEKNELNEKLIATAKKRASEEAARISGLEDRTELLEKSYELLYREAFLDGATHGIMSCFPKPKPDTSNPPPSML